MTPPSAITCPGCDRKTKQTGLVGAWIDASGRYRGSYVLCPKCSTIAQRGSEAERSGLTERVEHALMLAEEPPCQGAN